MKKIIIANWKSNKNTTEVKTWLQIFHRSFKPVEDVEVVIAPPFPFLSVVRDFLVQSKLDQAVSLAVQDISSFPAGRYTGAVSVQNLSDFHVKYAIVGHSERRKYFHESHQDVAAKVALCIDAGITPVVCVDDEYVKDQSQAIASEHLEKCVVAYEELSAIGTGENEPVDHVREVVGWINIDFHEPQVLYGGSVTSKNVKSYVGVCSGVLVGTASLQVEKFVDLINAAKD